MIKLLFLIPNLKYGGAEKVLVNLVNNLDKSKYDVTLYSIFDVGVNKSFLNKDVKYQSKFRHLFRGNTILMKFFSPRFLYRYFIKDSYDIVISYLEGPTARIISGCDNPTTKKMCWIHTEMLNEKIASTGLTGIQEAKKVYESFDLVAGVSQNVINAFRKQITDQVNSKVIYNVNDTEKIRERGKEDVNLILDKTKPNIFSVGKIVDVKGYDRLMDVHKKLIEEGIEHHIYVLGIGNKKGELEKKAIDFGVSGTFKFLGFDENPYKYVSKADLFVCSSYREGFSTAVTEALVLGTPVLSTNVSGAKELLGENNEYGIVTDNSAEDLYRGLKELITNFEKLSYYKKQAEIRGSFFSKEKTVKAVDDVFESLLHE